LILLGTIILQHLFVFPTLNSSLEIPMLPKTPFQYIMTLKVQVSNQVCEVEMSKRAPWRGRERDHPAFAEPLDGLRLNILSAWGSTAACAPNLGRRREHTLDEHNESK
jgi:hypothetical protein